MASSIHSFPPHTPPPLEALKCQSAAGGGGGVKREGKRNELLVTITALGIHYDLLFLASEPWYVPRGSEPVGLEPQGATSPPGLFPCCTCLFDRDCGSSRMRMVGIFCNVPYTCSIEKCFKTVMRKKSNIVHTV